MVIVEFECNVLFVYLFFLIYIFLFVCYFYVIKDLNGYNGLNICEDQIKYKRENDKLKNVERRVVRENYLREM